MAGRAELVAHNSRVQRFAQAPCSASVEGCDRVPVDSALDVRDSFGSAQFRTPVQPGVSVFEDGLCLEQQPSCFASGVERLGGLGPRSLAEGPDTQRCCGLQAGYGRGMACLDCLTVRPKRCAAIVAIPEMMMAFGEGLSVPPQNVRA